MLRQAVLIICSGLSLSSAAPTVTLDAIAPLEHGPVTIKNLTEIDISSSPNPLSATGNCAGGLFTWQASDWRSQDCIAAIHNMFVDEVIKPWGRDLQGFVTPGSGPFPRPGKFPIIWAPKRFEFSE